MFAVVWDLDGTLVDTEMNHYMAWRALMRENGRDLTFEQFKRTFGLRNDDILINYLGFSGDAARIEALSERKEVLFRASLERDGVRTVDSARELVEHLHSIGARQGIATSAPPANVELIMRLLGLQERFSAVVSAEEVARGKPAPDIVLRAAERLGVPTNRCVVLEDAPAGVAAAKAAGSRAIAITSTFPRAELGAADLIVDSFEEILWPIERWQSWLQP